MDTGFAASWIPIGRILKTVGYQGGLLIDAYPEYLATWERIDKCLIRIDGVWAPFFIVSKQEKADGMVVIFEDLGDNKLARSLIHQEVFVLPHQLITEPPAPPQDDEIEAWIGFTVRDLHSDFTAVIERVEELPSQLLAYVNVNGKTVAIPLADELIVDLDPDVKSVTLDLPSGILDL